MTATGGEMGEWPDDFVFYDLAAEWGVPPWEVEAAPVRYVERALLRKKILSQGQADAEENRRARNGEDAAE